MKVFAADEREREREREGRGREGECVCVRERERELCGGVTPSLSPPNTG